MEATTVQQLSAHPPTSGAATAAALVRRTMEHLATLTVTGLTAPEGVCDEGHAEAAAARAQAQRELCELTEALERLKAAAAAAQARSAVRLDQVVRAEHVARRVPAARRGVGVGHLIGLARHESPHRGSRALGLAKALTTELPHTLTALQEGALSEWSATRAAPETACLDADDRRAVDERLAGSTDARARLAQLTPDQVAGVYRVATYAQDPRAVVNRAGKEAKDRHVSFRPAANVMGWVSAILPARDAVACRVALTRVADSAKAAGDPRTRGQIMADTLVERLTGRAAGQHDVEVQVVLSSGDVDPRSAPASQRAEASPLALHALSRLRPATPTAGPTRAALRRARATGQAYLVGYGPIPLDQALELIEPPPGAQPGPGPGQPPGAGPEPPPSPSPRRVFLRRLLADPFTGTVIDRETTRRLFTPAERALLTTRDQTCAMPWCDAPIRHADHATPHARGGPTTIDNASGLCQACNNAKELPGWSHRRVPDGHGSTVLEITSPTGRVYSTAPPEAVPGLAPHRHDHLPQPEQAAEPTAGAGAA